MTYTSQIKIKAGHKLLKTYYDALLPEAEEKGKASYSLELSKDYLNINIKAKDATALKAISNTITNIISLIEKTWRLKNG